MALLRSLLSKFQSKQKTEPAEYQDPYQPLQLLRNNHELIDVKVARSGLVYQSMVLEVDTVNEELIIDDLFPAEGLADLVPGDSVEVISRSKKQVVNFFTRILSREINNGSAFYRLELPQYIGENQSRGSFRVYVDREQSLLIDLGHNDPQLQTAHIINLSPEGMKLAFLDDLEDKLKAKDEFSESTITLPDGFMIDCKIKIRNVYSMRSPQPHSLSGASLEIENPQQRFKFNQYLAAVQRKQRRRENRQF